jgi:retron-type reverse transcriptase
VLRLIRKWIQVGVIEEGRLLMSETGTGQGQPISPLLANAYLLRVAVHNRYWTKPLRGMSGAEVR